MPILVIAAYNCDVAGESSGSIDYQVRYFTSNDIDEVLERLRSEPPCTYKNCYGQGVTWTFHDAVAVEYDPQFADGEEIIGFITGRPMPVEDDPADGIASADMFPAAASNGEPDPPTSKATTSNPR